ncbi:hypothetical protein LT493_17835 [Streptomyces tricolor]|nr:hypothetical protein [Streptomyces tricolor]
MAVFMSIVGLELDPENPPRHRTAGGDRLSLLDSAAVRTPVRCSPLLLAEDHAPDHRRVSCCS